MNEVIRFNQTGVSASNPTGFNTTWYLFILLIILAAIAISLVLLMLSKNPKEWYHTSILKEDKKVGNLKDLAESIKMQPANYNEYAPLRSLIKKLFYEKIKSFRNVSDEDLQKMYRNDRATLQKYIRDQELINWLTGATLKKEKGSGFHFFHGDMGTKKDHYLLNLNHVLKKMEDWRP